MHGLELLDGMHGLELLDGQDGTGKLMRAELLLLRTVEASVLTKVFLL